MLSQEVLCDCVNILLPVLSKKKAEPAVSGHAITTLLALLPTGCGGATCGYTATGTLVSAHHPRPTPGTPHDHHWMVAAGRVWGGPWGGELQVIQRSIWCAASVSASYAMPTHR